MTWHRGGIVPHGRGPDGAQLNGTACQVAESGSGTVYMTIRDLNYGHIVTSVSTTSGDSWSVAELLDPIQAPDCEGSLIGLPAVGPGKDRLAMSHPRCTAAWCAPLPIYSRRYNMSLDLSDDGVGIPRGRLPRQLPRPWPLALSLTPLRPMKREET